MSGTLLVSASIALLVTLATNATLVGILRWRRRSRRRVAATATSWRQGSRGRSPSGGTHPESKPEPVVVEGTVDDLHADQSQPGSASTYFRSQDARNSTASQNPVVDRLRFLATQFVEDDPRIGTDPQSGFRHGDESGGRS